MQFRSRLTGKIVSASYARRYPDAVTVKLSAAEQRERKRERDRAYRARKKREREAPTKKGKRKAAPMFEGEEYEIALSSRRGLPAAPNGAALLV